MAEKTFECSNCGGLDTAGIISLIVAVVAAGFAGTALRISLREHQAFLAEVQARAKLAVSVSTVNADPDGTLRTDATGVAARIAIEILNEGEKAAGPTLITVLIPRSQTAEWYQPRGIDPGEARDLRPVDEVLHDPATGAELEAHYLSRIISRVPRKATTVTRLEVVFYSIGPPPPESGRDSTRTPILVRVEADEIPDDVDCYERAHELRIAWA